MENRSFIIILCNFQSNTLEIVHSIVELLELPREIHIPKCEKQPLSFSALEENLAFKFFDWSDFSETFFSSNGEIDFAEAQNNEHQLASILIFSPEVNLAEQFQQLFSIHEKFPIHILKIISIMDYRYFDGQHENLLDAMAYFADILLIDNGTAIDRNALKKFLEHCKENECYPLPIKILSQHSAKNIAELFDNQPRRMTLIFDDLDSTDSMGEEMVDGTPFSIPTLAQCDKYLKKSDGKHYCFPIELL
ncbi:MAG: hypothetical protein LBI77_02150 [Puniceicoccales bacterium]|jgi:hypothetical protein|nr:hypothetical protein [Puniceicoccales bacterium]